MCLCLAGYPTAVSRIVSAVVTDSVDGFGIIVSVGYRPLVEHVEVVPFLAHLYTATSVMRIVLIVLEFRSFPYAPVNLPQSVPARQMFVQR